MTYSRQDFIATVKEKARQRQSEIAPAYRVIQGAAVVMAKLTTQSEEWNRYLSYLQGRISQIRERKEIAQAKQNDPAIWDMSERNKLKADIIAADAMIAGLEWAMLIPKALVDGGEQATEFLNKLDRENDQNPKPADS